LFPDFFTTLFFLCSHFYPNPNIFGRNIKSIRPFKLGALQHSMTKNGTFTGGRKTFNKPARIRQTMKKKNTHVIENVICNFGIGVSV
jgi:hypothetical protein